MNAPRRRDVGAGDVVIAEGWRPGVVGAIVALHAVYYARAWGFGPFFEAKVARELAEFLDRYDGDHDRLFVAVQDEHIVGSLVIDGGKAIGGKDAHLRWFILDQAWHGAGIGARLMESGMAFLRAGAFARCTLVTFAGLDAARTLYERAGFRLVGEAQAMTWGTRVTEQRFEWQSA